MILVFDRKGARPRAVRRERKVKGANVHKDFHGALSFAIRHLRETYGDREMRLYLKQVARNVYAPLIGRVQKEGLKALKDHWGRVFGIEGGKFRQQLEGDTLVLEVAECPAIAHMKRAGYEVDKAFCLSTEIVVGEICRKAGLEFEVEYDTDKGRCRQTFRGRHKT